MLVYLFSHACSYKLLSLLTVLSTSYILVMHFLNM
uniref:Uncharacterized protein n=1 Tax=Setaria italica TaxID=4555 RepID=K3ZGR6_SETIT